MIENEACDDTACLWSRVPAPVRLVKKPPEIGSYDLPLRELPPHPVLAWRCTAMLAPLRIPAEVWDEWFEAKQ